jgi:hypothetical protein
MYWQKKPRKNIFASSNTPLFRFLGNYGFNFRKKKILEIGFYCGSDLIEFRKRGSNVYGLEINKFFVKKFKKIIGKNKIEHFDGSKHKIPFTIKFDLIFSHDFINYLNCGQIEDHVKNLYEKLKLTGLTLVAFLEEDLIKTKKSNNSGITINNKKIYYNKSKFTPKENPAIFHKSIDIKNIYKKSGFKLVGKKFVYETFDINEKLMKKTSYFLFKK